jgi:hypothetical protein
MTPVSTRDNDAASGNNGPAGDAALKALIPFSGDLAPEQVRNRMGGPNLNGPPAAIWRKTTIQHSNADGSYCLYACERTGEAMWVPVGDYFVADRPQGGQRAGTIMDHLVNQRQAAVRPEGYGVHHVGRTFYGENGNIRGPRNNRANMVGGAQRGGATRSHRFNPLVRQEPAVAGTGSRSTVARRERREKERDARQPPQPPVTSATTTRTRTSSAVVGDIRQGDGDGNHGYGITAPQQVGIGSTSSTSIRHRPIPTSIIITNSNQQTDGVVSNQINNLDLSDSEEEEEQS